MSRINVIFLVAFVGALVWVFLFNPEGVERIQRGALKVFRPSIEASTNLEETVKGFGEPKLSASELKELLDEAQRERDQLRLEVLKLDELFEENRALRSALNYSENSPLRLVPSQVIGRKPSTWYNTMVIDKGKADGIVPDSPVIVPVGDYAGLVGKISEVRNDNTSVIILATDEMCQVAARIEGTAEQGIISGQRGALQIQPDLHLRYLPKNATAKEGSKIISSGAGDLFPENLLLGEVKEFKVGAIDSEATVVPAVDFNKLKNVFVILPEKIEVEGEGGDPDTGAESPKPPDSNTGSPVKATTQVTNSG
ncbi:MAG: rod shape-determining protein MreC [Verrucomicrobiales bacterium]|nr:rod shape-determining protein MreC [Verrucomicrobiales bacterium]